ncbi:hypothetical protein [Bordetella genomosp. 5]|uniref:Lipoprotein n=1 Tax=Bordetella genomosp. 5 TaxID=1395608 RepID=A0A261TH88_9BORD|nr:hypothetical protein [Bordetella genomosp. 5]OZI48989.1 hypothetical protein CAL25_15305 [Bordetella genomosp. 5]
MKSSTMRVALSLLTLALGLSGCAVPEPSGKGTPDDPRYAKLVDLIGEALKANMSVVLVADLNPHKSLKYAESFAEWTPNVIWTHADKPEITFGRKFQNNYLQRDPNTTYLFKAFEVHILPPGKYLLTGGDDYKLDASLDKIKAAKGAAGSGRGAYGTAFLSAELYREYYKESNWKDATQHTQIKSRQVCTAVHRASGNCVAWGEEQYSETTQGMGAGYYEETASRDVPVIKVQTRVPPQHALASFSLKGGQLVLAQRMHLRTPSYKFRQAGCRATDSVKIECPLEDFTVYTGPAPMDFTQRYLAQRTLSDAHRALLSRIEPMKMTPLGSVGTEDPVWGVPLSLRKGR